MTATVNAAQAVASADNTQLTGNAQQMKVFQTMKEKHPDTLFLFRRGDFYEAINEDAETASKVLGILLTTRNNGEGAEPTKLAGFPITNLDTFLPKLIKAGHRVAICEEDGKEGQPKAKRGTRKAADKAQEKQEAQGEELLTVKAEDPELKAERQRAELQTRLEKLKRLQELNTRRTIFLATLESLEAAKSTMEAEDELQAKSYRLEFGEMYGRDKIFSISNREILLSFLAFMAETITGKVAELEEQIIKV